MNWALVKKYQTYVRGEIIGAAGRWVNHFQLFSSPLNGIFMAVV